VTVAIIAVIAVLLVLGVGLLIFWLMRRSQTEVPDYADARAAQHPQVVGTDEQGREVTASQEPPAQVRDAGAFESLLKDEIHQQGREEPAAPEEG
jgi:flagellar basal body-associated protein FliL